jgi:hypothetical protein
MTFPDFKVVPNTCPFCGYVADRAANTSGKRRPKPGDVSVCLKCTQPSFFGDDMMMRKPTAAEEVELSSDSEAAKQCRLLRRAMHRVDRSDMK